MAAKEIKRQSKTANEKGLHGGSLAGLMESITQQLKQNALPLLAFLTAIFVFYFPALSGEFIWDDMLFSEEKTIREWSGLWDIWFTPSEVAKEGHYWPLTYTTFWLEHKLFGLNTIGYHIVNCLLYFTNVVLIWRLLLRLEVPGAWAISMIFTVHPLHVESVAWLIERKDVLSAAFYLGALHAWLRFRESSSSKTYALALVLYALGLLTKSAVVTLPAALLVLLWWKQERISAQDVMRVLPFFIVGFAITLGDYIYYVSREVPIAATYSFLERVLIAGQSVWFYVGKLLWPTNLMVIYPHWNVSMDNLTAWLLVATTVGVPILLWSCRHRTGKGPLAGVAFFLITLSPILGFVNYGYMDFSFVADRYQYLAGLGLMAILVGGAVHAMQPYITSFRPVAIGVFTVLVVGLGTLTWRQATIYQDEVAFFSHIVAHNPTAHDAYLNLGHALLGVDRIEEGYEAALKAIELQPNNSKAHSNVTHALFQMGRYDEAEESVKRALELKPKNKVALLNYGGLHLKQQRYEEAIAMFLKAIDLGDDSVLGPKGIADSYYELGQHTKAMEWIDRALALNPTPSEQDDLSQLSVKVLLALGRTEEVEQHLLQAGREGDSEHELWRLLELHKMHAKQGDDDKASTYLQRALELAEGDSESLSDISHTLVLTERYEEAEESLTRALELDPKNEAAWQNYGGLHYKQKRYEEAIAAFQEAINLGADSILAYRGIASSYYRLGQYASTMEWIDRALALAPTPSEQDKLSRLSAKVQLALSKTEEMEQHLLQTGREDDSDREMSRLLGLQKMSAEQGDTDKASAYLQRILKLAEGNPESLQIVADTLRMQKQYAEAIEIYKEILAIDLDFAKAYGGMGDALFRLERYEEAIKSLERSVELQASSSLAIVPLLLMGQAARRLDRPLDSAQYYERAVELDPQNASALEHLAAARFEEKRYEDALRLFTALRDSQSGNAQIHSNIGATLYHLGRLEEAIRSFETALSLDPSMEHVRSNLEQLKKELEGQE